MTGTLHGVGVGPGDPDLLTLRAHRLISTAEIVAYPAPDSGESFARRIVSDLIPKNALEIPIVVPMRVARFPAQDIYDGAAERLAAELTAGRDVVLLCEGDPLFYGSFMYLHNRLSHRFAVSIVPGVSSVGAATAVAGAALCARNEALRILPAPLADQHLESELARPGAAVILKLGRHLPRIRSLLDRMGLAQRSSYVAHASLPEQSVLPLSEAPATAPYFSLILVPGTDPFAIS